MTGVFVDGKCYHFFGIHTDPMGINYYRYVYFKWVISSIIMLSLSPIVTCHSSLRQVALNLCWDHTTGTPVKASSRIGIFLWENLKRKRRRPWFVAWNMGGFHSHGGYPKNPKMDGFFQGFHEEMDDDWGLPPMTSWKPHHFQRIHWFFRESGSLRSSQLDVPKLQTVIWNTSQLRSPACKKGQKGSWVFQPKIIKNRPKSSKNRPKSSKIT